MLMAPVLLAVFLIIMTCQIISMRSKAFLADVKNLFLNPTKTRKTLLSTKWDTKIMPRQSWKQSRNLSKSRGFLSSELFCTKPLVCVLVKHFIVSILTYCPPVLYNSIDSRDEKAVRNLLNRVTDWDLDSVVAKCTRTFVSQLIHDGEDFMNNSL